MSKTKHEVDGSRPYYFLCQIGGKYHPLFVGFLLLEIIDACMEREEGGWVCIRLKVGEHRFASWIDCPIYLLKCENDGAIQFASDDGKLELFSSGVSDDKDLPPVIDFPAYWTAGIEPMLEFKLGTDFCVNENGVWKPSVVTNSRGGPL